MTTEALRTQVDNLQWEVNRLDAENRKLREQDTEASQRVDLGSELERTKEDLGAKTVQLEAAEKLLKEKDTEIASLKTEHAIAEEAIESFTGCREELLVANERVSELERELAEARGRADDLAERVAALQQQHASSLETLQKDAELTRYRCLEEERVKWETREEMYLQQIKAAKSTTVVAEAKEGGEEVKVLLQQALNDLDGKREIIAGLERANESQALEIEELKAQIALLQAQLKRREGTSTPTLVAVDKPPDEGGGASTRVDTPTLPSSKETEEAASKSPLALPLPMVMGTATSLLSQLPQIPTFAGDRQRDGEPFQDWLEQFEAVAQLGGWSDHAKLVNLTTRLRGTAYSFYRSCTPSQRSTYGLLTDELKKRFTPVKLTAITSQMFHERRQGPKETVDEFAQELKKLFAKAYVDYTRGGPEAEKMGELILTNQFVSGLRQGLKTRVVGTEGNLDKVLVKARFEEAKLNLPRQDSSGQAPPKKPPVNIPPESNSKTTSEQSKKESSGSRSCFNCGMSDHLVKSCPYPRQPKGDSEARGKPRRVGSLSTSTASSPQERMKELRLALYEAELEDALEGIVRTIQSSDVPACALGPSAVAAVEVNGVPTDALIDTGSPATIVSLPFLTRVLKGERDSDLTMAEWKSQLKGRFSPPTVALKSYGGGKVNIIAQIPLHLRQGPNSVEAVVLVQPDAPNPLLIGTDVQTKLGFALVMEKSPELVHDVLQGEEHAIPTTQVPVEPQSRDVPKPERIVEETAAGSPSSLPPGDCEVSTVRLLNAVKVRPRSRKMVLATVVGPTPPNLSLFTPRFSQDDCQMADAVVDLSEGRGMTLFVENHGVEPVCLKKGTVLGGVVEVEEMIRSTSQDVPQQPVSKLSVPSGERDAELFTQLNMQLDHLSTAEQEKLTKLIQSYSDVFALNASELGATDVVEHSIDTGDHRPIRQPMRRTPFALRSKVDTMVKEMLDQGVITPSKSPWSSPVVLVRKKDGGMRFCIDYRQLNSITKLDEFPLPRIDDTLGLLAGARYFTTLDLAAGYWQVRMDPHDQEKTAFSTYAGLYEFQKMPFGLVNAPATFQRLMEVVLSGLAREGCLVYLDDVLVVGRTLEEHNRNLTKVLQRFREAGLRLKPVKCKIARTEVYFLGHVVSEHGVKTDPEKLRAVREFPTPTCVKSLRSFLGLASYYRRFIPDFAKVAGPLHNLTKRDVPFVWTPLCQQRFTKLKELLTSAPVLVFPDFKEKFLVETDASRDGLGAVLAQQQSDGTVRPIAYASRTLQPHERNYGVTELEGLGVVWALKHFRPYLYGHPCEVYTDHEALKSLLNTPHPSGKLARWGLAIQELDVTIRYRPGKHNSNADALSRQPVPQNCEDDTPTTYGIISAVTPSADVADLGELQRDDPELVAIVKYLETGVLPEEDKVARALALSVSQYHIEDGILYHVESDHTLRVIPPTTLRQQLFQQVHAGVFGAHLRDDKVHSELKKHYWWPGMRADVSRWSRGCLVCATHHTGTSVRPPLTPIPVAGPFDRIGVDVIQFPRTHDGNQYAIVFMDYLTKWPEVFPAPDQTAATIATLLVEQIVSRHGVPSEVLSDRGRAFLSELMKEVEKLLGFHKVNTSAYHPQTDGLVERFNRTLTTMLAKSVQFGARDWDRRLPYVLFAYRASQQQSTAESPFFLLYGRDPRLPVQDVLSPPAASKLVNLKDYGANLAQKMSQAWELARTHIGRAQKRQKQYYDTKSRPSRFNVGERVFLFKPAEKTGEARKLARPFHGPFRIIDLTSTNARIRRVDKPQEEPILVALERLRTCPDEIGDEFWPPDKGKNKAKPPSAVEPQQSPTTGAEKGSTLAPGSIT